MLRAAIGCVLLLTPHFAAPADLHVVAADQDDGTALAADPRDASSGRLRTLWLDWIAATDVWFHAGPLGAYVTLQDDRMSPLIYSGPGAGFGLSGDVIREKWLWPHSATFRYAWPAGTPVLPGSYESISGEADVSLQYRLSGTGFSVGGGAGASMHVRRYDKLQNNMLNTDFAVSLNFAGGWQRGFTVFARSAIFHVRADVPLVSWITRSPAFGIHGSRAYWAPPSRYFRATIETALTWELPRSPGNNARMRYIWDFYSLDEHGGYQKLRIATHTLALSVGTRIG
jgi:hypothetical protein